MLEPILGSINKERVLFYLWARQEAYAREIARFYETSLSPVQKALDQMEAGGIAVRREAGTTILYQFNPRYPLLVELTVLIKAAFKFLPKDNQDALRQNRRRPRRKAKPL